MSVNAAEQPLGQIRVSKSKIAELTEYLEDGQLDMRKLLIAIDDQLIEEGVKPFQRPFHAAARISGKLGIQIGANDPLFQLINDTYEDLYGKSELYMPPMYVGAFMFRDVFIPLRIPVFYGTVRLEPFRALEEAHENLIKWLGSDQESTNSFIDQWIDALDFTYGLDGISKRDGPDSKAVEYWKLAKQQLESAAATLCGSFDQYVAIQNSLLAIELLLKGALFELGDDEKQIKAHGHNLGKALARLVELSSKIDQNRLTSVVESLPALVERRYQAQNYKRTEIGNMFMGAQYIAGEILRAFSDQDARKEMREERNGEQSPVSRIFPASNKS